MKMEKIDEVPKRPPEGWFETAQHVLIKKKCKELLEICTSDDYGFVKYMIYKCQSVIDSYNDAHYTIADASKKELATWGSGSKKTIYAEFFAPYIKKFKDSFPAFHGFEDIPQSGYEKIDAIKAEYHEAFEQTVFCDKLKLKKIYLNRRRWPRSYTHDPLEKAIDFALKVELIKTFQEQNEKLISKYT